MKNKTPVSKFDQTDEERVLGNVFSLFYSTDVMRPVMLKPFVVGNKTYATDAYTLVRCDNDKIDFEFENNEKPLNIEGAIPEINTSEIISIDQIDWVSLMNKDETIGDGNDVECGHCNGEGSFEDNFFYKGRFYDFEYECPVCDGTGYEEEEMQIPTGNKTFGSNDMVKFKDIYFYATKFYKLKKVKDLIGGEVELISYNSNKRGVLFRIGIVEILIMPCMSNSYDNVVANIESVGFNISDKVHMDSPFGMYTGVVKDVKDGVMTIESYSPTGKGTMLADYYIEGTEWKKY
jgi:hypothetical protein